MTIVRADLRRLAALGVLFAAGLFVVVLGAHVTPAGYHGHVRHVAPHSYAPRPAPSSSQPAAASSATADNLEHAGSAWVSVPLLLGAAAVLLLVAVAVVTILPRPGRWARRGRSRVSPGPDVRAAADDLAGRLAQAVDAGIDQLADGPVADAIIACWLSLRDAALAAGVEQRQSDTPEEFVSRVLESAQVRPAPLRELAALYREARFSAHAMSEADSGAARVALQAVGADLAAGAHA